MQEQSRDGTSWKDRKWMVDLRVTDPQTGEKWLDPEHAVEKTINTYIECATIQAREGGIFAIGPIRGEYTEPQDSLHPGERSWANFGLVVEHKYAPSVRPAQSRTVQAVDTSGEHGAAPFIGDGQGSPAPGLFMPTETAEMRDEDERAVAAALDEAEPGEAVVPQAPDPVYPSGVEGEPVLTPEQLVPEVH